MQRIRLFLLLTTVMLANIGNAQLSISDAYFTINNFGYQSIYPVTSGPYEPPFLIYFTETQNDIHAVGEYDYYLGSSSDLSNASISINITFALSAACTYIATNFPYVSGSGEVGNPNPIIGLSGTSGYLPAGTYAISDESHDTGWFGFDVTFQVQTNPKTLTGEVYRESDSSPIAGASVQIGNYSVTTDTGGNYSIIGIPPGTFSATVGANNYTTLTNSVTISTNSSVQKITNNFALYPLPSVTGYVYCSCDSNAIAGASVQIGDYSTTCDASGAYVLTNVIPGTYEATISGNNFATLMTNLTVPSAMAEITNSFSLTNLTFVINPVFDPSITGDANAATITNSIKAAIQVYEQTIANPLCVTILFSTTSDPNVLGENNAALASISYSQYLADLKANPNKSANDNSALANLPAGLANEINGNTQVTITAANLAAIGESGVAAAAVAGGGAGYYGRILINVSSLIGLQATAAHEIDETLGIGGWGSSLELSGSYSGQASPTTGVGSLDLFRFSGSGVRSFTLSPTATSYFSIDGGKTELVYFNQYGNGSDFGDWGDGVSPADGLGNDPPQVQDAFGSANPSVGANEFIALDVVGYTLMAPSPAIHSLSYGFHSFALDWSALPGQSYQVQFTTNLTENVWNNLGSLIIASNTTARVSDANVSNVAKFYRVVVLSPIAIPILTSLKAQANSTFTPYTLATNTNTTHRFLRMRPSP